MGYYYGIGGEFYLIAIVFSAISMIVSQRLKSKFKTYSKSRHEPLSDVEKEIVWKDISNFFRANL